MGQVIQSALNPAVIISRHQEAVIAIYINRMQAADHLAADLPIAANRQVLPLQEVQAAQAAAIVTNPRQQRIHPMAAVPGRAIHQRRRAMNLMTMDMMTYIWMMTMTMTDTIVTAIMQMASMMRWMS